MLAVSENNFLDTTEQAPCVPVAQTAPLHCQPAPPQHLHSLKTPLLIDTQGLRQHRTQSITTGRAEAHRPTL